MVAVLDKLQGPKKNLNEVLRIMIKEEADFRMEHKEKKLCRRCKIPLKLEDKWLLDVPSIYTLGLQYPDIDMMFSPKELKQIFDTIDPKIDMQKFMRVSKGEDTNASFLFVLRGLIVYYGKHYWAYFYSEKFDGWF